MDFSFDPNFDFTQDTEGYWQNWWTTEKGDELIGTKHVSDPDSQSKTLNEYHKAFWTKKLPDGRLWDLQSKKVPGYIFEWTDGTEKRRYSSDSLLNSFRWYGMKDLLSKVKEHVEKDLHQDYRKWLEDYVRKLYTMGGMIIFPRHYGSINVSRARTPMNDRIDLTFECIRRWYVGEKSPMSNCLEKDRDFFNLFNSSENGLGNFKNYVDFFLLQDIVSEDYQHVKCLFGDRKYCDDFFKSPGEETVPKTVSEYMQWYKNTIEFAEKRNKRMVEWVKNN